MVTRFIIKIPGKTLKDCSFNERLAWASVVNCAEALRLSHEVFRGSTRITYEVVTRKKWEKDEDAPRPEDEASLNIVRRFATQFFPEIQFEIGLERIPDEGP